MTEAEQWPSPDECCRIIDTARVSPEPEAEPDDEAPERARLRPMIDEKRLLEQFVRVSPTTLWRMIKRDEFPPPVLVSGRKFWFEDKVVSWQTVLDQHGGHRRRAARHRRGRSRKPSAQAQQATHQ
jgi:predicted DNA-binding transcriptional regulator AlpA